ncbi:sporulation histidine kinase inhibitor Sda [Paenibacillus alkalitolerans]|nr:sporulation histidine kinase inhibitor Sda [Paenibacillus alkalitolerans]
MNIISDELLIEVYHKSKELNLSQDFLSILLEEINRRSLTV